jgi:hypothetical protein
MTKHTKRSVRPTIELLRHSLIGTVVCLLGACASAPNHGPGVSTDVLDALHQKGIKQPLGEAADFQERTKGKVAAATAISATFAVLGGGWVYFGQRNQKPGDGYVSTSNRATVFNDDETLKYVDANVATTEALRRKLSASGISISNQSDYTISSTEKFWGIDYEKMSENDNYRLYFNIETTLLDGKEIIQSYSCLGVTEDKGGYAYWMDNDKENVKRHATAIGDICADRALAAFGLRPSSDK